MTPKQRIHARRIRTYIAVGSLILFCAGCSRFSSKARHLRSGDQYFAAGQYQEAEIEYKNVMKSEPANGRAISQLGLIYFDQGSLGKAYPYLRKGHELEPENLDLRLKLGQVALKSGDYKEAITEANFVLGQRPTDPNALLLLEGSSLKPREMEATEGRLRELLATTPANAPVLVALGTLDLRQRKLTSAEESFRKALSLDPKSIEANFALGALFWMKKDLEHADEYLAVAAKLSPVRSPWRVQYAQFKVQTGDLQAARLQLNKITQEAPDFVSALILLAQVDAAQKNYPEAQSAIAKALTRDGANPEALMLGAQLELATGKTEKAVAALERMEKIYPKAAQVRYKLAEAYVAHGDTDKAATSLYQAISLDPNLTDASLLLAKLNLKKGEYKSAAATLTAVVKSHPNLVSARLLLAESYRDNGDFDSALEIYRQLAGAFPRNPQVPLLEGLIYLQENKNDEARQAFTRALELSPSFLPALEQMVNVDLVEKNYPAAIERANREIEKDPKLASPRLLLAKIYLAQNDPGRAEAALLKTLELQPDSQTAYLLLARLYVNTNRQEKALADLRSILAINPSDVGALMMTGVINERQGNYAAASDSYEKLLAVQPLFNAALNNLAYLYSEKLGKLDRAYDLAQRARELEPSEPHAADTLGWILYKKRQYPLALTLLQESAEALPNEADVHFHLGMALYMMGSEENGRVALQQALALHQDFDGHDEAVRRLAILDFNAGTGGPAARAILEKSIETTKDDPVALVRLAAVYEHDGDPAKAIAAYRAALQLNPANLRVLTDLIRLYSAQNDTAAAFEMAKTLRKIAPDDPDLDRILGRLAYQTGDYPWSYSLLQEAVKMKPDDSEVLFDQANAAFAVGKLSEAEDAMRHASLSELSAARRDEAKRFLEMIDWSEDPSQAEKHAAAIRHVLEENPGYPPALLALARADERSRNSAEETQAYEKILANFRDFSPAQKGLAILYSEDPAKTQQAVDLAVKARETYPDDAELSKALGIAVYRQKDFARAASVLKAASLKLSADAELWYFLGMSQFQLNDKVEGRKSLKKAMSLNLEAKFAPEAARTLATPD